MSESTVVQSGVSEIVYKDFIYKWKLCNYRILSHDSRTIYSPTFSLKVENSALTFNLYAYPETSDTYACITMNIDSYSNLTLPLSIITKISFHRDDEDKEGFMKSEFKSIPLIESRDIYPIFNFKEKTYNYNKICGKDNYIIYLKISFPTINVSFDENKISINSQTLEKKCLDNLEHGLEAEKYTDFTIVSPCGRQLRAHKFILTVCSPVFAALIENDMMEKKTNCVEIKDVSYEALKEMLRFMYSARVENLEKLSVEVMEAAEKYQIDDLRNLCLEYTFKNITVDNAAKALDLSFCFDLDDLKKRTMRLLKTSAAKVLKTKGFASLNKGSLAAEIIRALAEE